MYSKWANKSKKTHMKKRRMMWISKREEQGSAEIPGRALAEVSWCVVITSYWLHPWQLKNHPALLLYCGALRNIMRDQSCFIDIWYALYMHLKAHRSYTLWPVDLMHRCPSALFSSYIHPVCQGLINPVCWWFTEFEWMSMAVLSAEATTAQLSFDHKSCFLTSSHVCPHTRKRPHPLPLPLAPSGTHTPRCPSSPATKQWQLVQTPRSSLSEHRHPAHCWGTSWVVLQGVCTKARGDFQ